MSRTGISYNRNYSIGKGSDGRHTLRWWSSTTGWRSSTGIKDVCNNISSRILQNSKGCISSDKVVEIRMQVSALIFPHLLVDYHGILGA
jgi:hypothetical protein